MARVFVITPSYNPRLGGVEQHVWSTSQALLKKGWTVTIITQRFPGLPVTEVKKGITIHRFEFPKVRFLGLLSIWRTMILRYSSLVSQADVIHIHDVFIWYLPLRLLFWRKPVVTTFHGWEGLWPVPFKNILIRKIAVLLSNKTIAIGRYLEKYYRFKANEVLYGAVNAPARLAQKEKLLLYVGRLDYDTGLPVLLQSLKAQAWPGRVVLCGDGLLREQAELVGEVRGFADPRPFLKKAQVVFAGGYLSILEAFAYRCAVVAVEKNPLKKDYYLMSPFASWMTLVNSPAELTHQLAILAKGSASTADKTKQAFTWAKTQTWQSIADQYIKLYDQVLHR